MIIFYLALAFIILLFLKEIYQVFKNKRVFKKHPIYKTVLTIYVSHLNPSYMSKGVNNTNFKAARLGYNYILYNKSFIKIMTGFGPSFVFSKADDGYMLNHTAYQNFLIYTESEYRVKIVSLED